MLIADPERRAVAEPLGVELLEDYEAFVAGPTGRYPDVDEDALAAISYTGGTTGTPKGVMLSHRNLLANALHNLVATGHAADDRWLHVCPMFHVAGTSNVFACTWVGARPGDPPPLRAARRCWRRSSASGSPTRVFVPTMLAMLLEHAEGADVSSAAPPAVRGVADLARAAAARARVAARLRRRPVLRHDRGRADGHPASPAPTIASARTGWRSMGAPVPGRAGRGARRCRRASANCGCAGRT